MEGKSDGESENIRDQIKQLEKQKNDLERKITDKEHSEKKNRDRQALQQRLRELQGAVSDLQGASPSKSSGRGSGEDQCRSDVSFLNDSRDDRIQDLQNRFLEKSATASTSRGRRNHGNRDDLSDDISDDHDDGDDVMSKRHKQAIQLNRSVLVESMISDDIFNDLIANKILTTADVGRIKEKNTTEAVNEELLNNLIRKSDRAFHVFVRSLRKTLQEYLANRIDPASSAKKKKRKRQTGELNVNVDCDEVVPISKRQQTCSCQEVEEQILVMAKTAYRNIRRRDDTPASFQQFQKELRETNAVIKDSMEVMHTLKILCRHGDMADVSHGSIKFTLICSSIYVVKDLWNMYKSGKLLEIFQNGLVTGTLRKRCRAKSIRLRVKIAEDEYFQCIGELETQATVHVVCSVKPKKKRTSVRTLRSRQLTAAYNCENIPSRKSPRSSTEQSPRRVFREIQPNHVMSTDTDTKKSAGMPCYDLRNRSQAVQNSRHLYR